MEYADRVKETTSATSTTTLALAGAATGYRSFASAFSIGASGIPVCVADDAENWEIALYTLSGSATLTRERILGSSNSDAAVTFPSGAKDVFVTVPASELAKHVTVDDIEFSELVPLTSAGARYMPQQNVSSALTFTPDDSPVRDALVYVRLIADGVNEPDFSAFREWGGSLGWDNTAGICNQVQFFYDGYDYWHSISQEVGAVPAPSEAEAITLNGPASGIAGVPSTSFTVGVSPVGGTISGTVTVTPSDGGAGGSFAPTSVGLTTASPSATFTYTAATEGAKTISVTNNGGLSNPSGIAYTAAASATVPDAPTIGTATAGDASASVTFTASADDGGSAITGYTVTSSPGGITATGTSSPVNITGLTNGTEYTFTVHATNAIGDSAESALSNAVTPEAGSQTYATFNPADSNANIAFTNGDLTGTRSAGATGWTAARGNTGKSAGKWYWECSLDFGTSFMVGIGTSSATLNNFPGADANGRGYFTTGQKWASNSGSAYGATYTAGDVIGVALDMTAGTIEFFKNGVSQGVAFTGLSGTYFPMVATNTGNGAFTANFGATAFVHSVPSGFNAGLYS